MFGRRNKKRRLNFHTRFIQEQSKAQEIKEATKEQSYTPVIEQKQQEVVVKEIKVKATPLLKTARNEPRVPKKKREYTTKKIKDDLVIIDSGDEYPESEYKTLLIELGQSIDVKDFFSINKKRIKNLPNIEIEKLLNQASKSL